MLGLPKGKLNVIFGNPGITKKIYKQKNKNSMLYPAYSLSGLKLGYLENDEHLRNRIKNFKTK